jgi:hypothetical protein
VLAELWSVTSEVIVCVSGANTHYNLASKRPQLEACPTRQSYGNQRLHGQLEEVPDDRHNSARNMLSVVYATKQ